LPVAASRSGFLWYILGGILFILSGIFAILGFKLPNLLPLLLVVAGIAVIVGVLSGHGPGQVGLAIFILGMIAFGLVASGAAGPRGPFQSRFEFDKITASTSNGRVEGSIGGRETVLSTSNGRMSLTLKGPGTYDMSASNGDISVALKGDAQAKIDA